MTFEQYITNPMGKNNAILSASVRELTRKDYTSRFNNLLLRENGKITYFIYKENNKVFYFHIKIPSEVVKDFYYDVVIRFEGTGDQVKFMKGLEEYQVQFYSNDPAFVYTYAHVFRRNNLFINALASKMSKESIRKPPKEKNPQQLVGYVKSLFFAYLFMKQRGLFHRVRLESAQPLDMKFLIASVEHADKVIARRQEEGAKVSKKKKVEITEKEKKRLDHYLDDKSRERLVTKTNTVAKVKRTQSGNKKGVGNKTSIQSSKSTNKF